jgi:hypothetical protein
LQQGRVNAGAESILWHYRPYDAEVGGPHHLPHFHAYYQDDVAVIGLDPIELIAGELPRRQRRLVEAWAELHQIELIANWERLQRGESTEAITPLE